MNKNDCRSGLLILVTAAVLASGCGRDEPGQTQRTIPSERQNADAAGFKEFTDRVKDYVKLHKVLESGLPAAKPTVEPEMIIAHQMALARKIREARPDAKAGDIFTPAARESFKHAIKSAMQGPHGTNADATMKQGAPLTETNLTVNQPYPDKVPYTTVPPTLLQVFPPLPDEVVYRVVVHDLVLLDLKADLVLDLIPGVIP